MIFFVFYLLPIFIHSWQHNISGTSFPLLLHRPYTSEFVANDPQRRLDIEKPQLPNGESPPGFIGHAVNMITIETKNLLYLTSNGLGLRETLFYHLFSHLQVYKTRSEMLLALPYIRDGAVSLDGGIIKTTSVFSMGNR